MEAILINLAFIGLPIAGAIGLGFYWLSRSVFKDVSLNDAPTGNREVTKAEQTASALELQLLVAEDLGGIDPGTLNALATQAEQAKKDADLVRQEQEATALEPVPVPWLSPVAAVHSVQPNDKQKQDPKDKK